MKATYYLDYLIMAAIFVLALGVRLYKIEVVTPGIWNDEIVVSQVSERLVERGEFVPFVEDNYGHPTPLLYLTGFVIKSFGRSLTSLRLVSVTFGALGIAIFYLLLRLFFAQNIAVLTSLVAVFTYSHLIVSRFAYEMTAAVFFQILTVIFIYLGLKEKNNYLLLFSGLSLGAGLYTYLGFRSNALALITLVFLFIFFKEKISLREKIVKVLLILTAVFIVTAPLLGYATRYPEQIWARTKSVSIFHQNLPKEEIIKEIKGSALRTFGMFFFTGDPNPRQNPSGRPMFDPITVGVAFVGLTALFFRKRQLFFLSLFLAIPTFANDIFSVEFFPEFHYYGTGHPNTLRISTFVPIFLFWFAWGLATVEFLATKIGKYVPIFITSLISLVIIYLNWGWYFNQPISRFNYVVNGVRVLKIVNFLNKNKPANVLLSKSFFEDPRVAYFLDKKIAPELFNPQEKETLEAVEENKLIIIDPQQNPNLAKELIGISQSRQINIDVRPLINPWREIEALIVYKPS